MGTIIAASTICVTLLLSVGDTTAAPYYGKVLADTWPVEEQQHITAGVGKIYSASANRVIIKNFNYDGVPPTSFFVLGKIPYEQASRDGKDETMVILTDERGSSNPLGIYNNEDITLTFPDDIVLTDFKYLSIYCRNFTTFFGGITIPEGFAVPAPVNIGQFAQRQHEVRSGEVTVLDSRTFFIRGLHYDGQGPDAFFYIGNTDQVTEQNSAPYGKIPDEKGRMGVISAYSNDDITIRLPEGVTVFDIKWLSLWCIRFTANFGEVRLDNRDLNVPPYLEISVNNDGMNCISLDDDLQVSWLVNGGDIYFKLSGVIGSEQYMAFGLSGSTTTYQMLGADVVVAHNKGSQPYAVDSYLNQYSQCDNSGQGACPDQLVPNGKNDVTNVSVEITDGITSISYSRPLVTGDSTADQDYKIDGTMQSIVWGIGPVNSNNAAAKHTKRIDSPMTINFNRMISSNCPRFVIAGEVVKPDFTTRRISGEKTKTFEFVIGQAGGDQGYKALTGFPSWGIAWYVNGILVPELYLKRGETYTFKVYGGRNASLGAMYHPLYLTSSEVGGKQQVQDSDETIYPHENTDGQTVEKTVGDYCEYKLTQAAIQGARDGKIYGCFEEFQKGLYLDCPANAQYGEFTWTPTDETPDLLYYQCFTHKNLGWKIHVGDEYTTEQSNEGFGCPINSSVTLVASTFLYVLLAVNLLFF